MQRKRAKLKINMKIKIAKSEECLWEKELVIKKAFNNAKIARGDE